MPRKLALKRLTASDLTLFKWHFQNRPAGKQKAFNLDARILVGELYPQLGEPSLVPQPRYPLDLYLSGPGLAPAYNLQRKILKQHKNWRLNGELIDDPVELPGLYEVLEPGDFALFDFSGETAPSTARVALIARALPDDQGIHSVLVRHVAEGSMQLLDEDLIEKLLAEASPPAGHPLFDWAEESLLEEAALGGAVATEAIAARRGNRGVSPEDFQRSRRNAEATGIAGEVLLNAWLDHEQFEGRVSSFEWTASINAIAPYDFRIVRSGSARLIDAKSTSGKFSRALHLSLMELEVAVNSSEPYDIYRLYEVTEVSALMRIASDVGPSLRPILGKLKDLPKGVSVDSISLSPDMLAFSVDVIELSATDD